MRCNAARVVLCTLLAAAGAGAAAPGSCQTSDTSATSAATGGLEEITVTATRREERLQDVPISVSAFSQEKLDAEGLRNIDDLSRLSPGVTFSRNGTGSSANYNDENSDINIRGVDSAAGTSTTGIYIDDTPVQSRHLGFGAGNSFAALFDLERVEVLRGPQGTLFGAGAEGGAVRFITAQPSLTINSGYARAEVGATRGGDPSYEAGGAVGGPIVNDVLGFRVSASFRRDGGWVDRVNYTPPVNGLAPPTYTNTTATAANWQQTVTFRGALKWKLSDTVSLTPSIYYQRLQVNDTAAYWQDLSNPDADVYRNGNALRNPSTDPYWLAAVKLDWDVGFAQLASNTAYLSRDQHSISDYTQYLRATWTYFGQLPSTYPPPGAGGYAPFGDVQRNFYEEIRLSSSDAAARVTWTGGVFFSHLSENIPEDIVDPTLDSEVTTFTNGMYAVCVPGDPVFACPNGLIYHGPLDKMVDKQIAVFGEANIRLTETLKATLGLRYSKLDYTGSVYQTGPFLATTIQTESSASERPLTPKVVLSWQPARDRLVYAGASKGFRPGGVNVGVGAICNGDLVSLGLPLVPGSTTDERQLPVQFSSDHLWSYEIGGKSTLLNHRLQVNSSLFYIDWKDIQQNVYLPSCGEQFTANLGKVQSRGGDIEVLYRPIEALLLDVTAAYTDAKFTASSCAGALTYTGVGLGCNGIDPTTQQPISAGPIVSDGDRLLGSPWSFTAAAEYHFRDWQSRTPYLRLDYQHTTAQTALLPIQNGHNARNDPTLPGLPITNNLGLRAGLRFNGWDVSVYGQNLTDSHPLLFRSRDIADDSVDQLYFGRGARPRTIGATATYRF